MFAFMYSFDKIEFKQKKLRKSEILNIKESYVTSHDF